MRRAQLVSYAFFTLLTTMTNMSGTTVTIMPYCVFDTLFMRCLLWKSRSTGGLAVVTDLQMIQGCSFQSVRLIHNQKIFFDRKRKCNVKFRQKRESPVILALKEFSENSCGKSDKFRETNIFNSSKKLSSFDFFTFMRIRITEKANV